ncbi:tyrosine-type recombinase/integrase [Bradyrhizobium ivorense]|uniref:tyrosine-type recombinase/integrase n=1 Tax=Bradyrhizobium ivorense TaxID=2511166 RepID=UPI0010BB6B89|nr:tyrosine-type recombinase/integrase [Bradyrhizobium ivorense]VIO69847.1 Tyrosine recombinase XerC [Bradyrhizobium ivorense]
MLVLAKALPSHGGTIERGNTYFALFAVLYGLGLRVGEACRLRLEDVDLERRLLIIRETKFYKSRLVPFGPKLGTLLEQHLRQRQTAARAATAADDAPLFSLHGGRPINPGTISQTFHAMVPSLNLHTPPGISPPRLHNLRHSFAVGALTRWYRLGLDPQTKLLALSTFIGHGDVNSTAVYLTPTPELLEHANRRFRAFACDNARGGSVMPPSLGTVVQSSFTDHLPAQKGMRLGSIRSYRDTIRLFLCFVSEQLGRRIATLALMT